MKCTLFLLFYYIRLTSTLQLILPSVLEDVFDFSSRMPKSPFKDEKMQIRLNQQWSILGPFPAGMREHQMGALPVLTMYPLSNLFSSSNPVQIPSAYGRAGYVTAKEVQSIEHVKNRHRAWHSVRTSYSELDWKAIQQSEGWAGIQWQALSVADLHIEGKSTATLSMILDSAAEFAVLSEKEFLTYTWDNRSLHMKWYNSDWYGCTREILSDNSEAPGHLLRLEPGKYKVLVKSVYEVRIFGAMKGISPAINFRLDIRMQEAEDSVDLGVVTKGQFAIVPNVVDGIFAGWGVAFALRNYRQQSITIEQIKIVGEAEKYFISKSSDLPLLLAPFQVRPVKLKLTTVKPLSNDITTLMVQVKFQTGSETKDLIFNLSLKHIEVFSSKRAGKEVVSYLYTYLDFDNTVQNAIANPPKNFLTGGKSDDQRPAILYLHGAGVDVRSDEAQNTFDPQNRSWVIQPSGRSPWGYDWQIASQLSARTALKQFSRHMYGLPDNIKDKAARIDTNKVMITGHSNGGQGANHYANHRPDEVIGAVIAAGYITLAEYVPMTWQLGRHFNDAALNGILRSSINAFENNLFASNLAGIPCTIKYGTNDDNVPPWHSRELASLIQSWNQQSHASKELIKVSEVANRSHWWPEIMKEADVQSAIDARLNLCLNPDYQMPNPLDHFTLSVFNPEDSGSKQGWKITQVEVPGRIARLEVEYLEGGENIKVRSAHVSKISVDVDNAKRAIKSRHIDIDGTIINIGENLDSKRLTLIKTRQGWTYIDANINNGRSIGPMIRFLSSSGPIYAIVPTKCDEKVTQHYFSIALRFSTDAYLYGRLDTVILYDYQALNEAGSSQMYTSNTLLLGGPTINYISRIASKSQSAIKFLSNSSQFSIQDRLFADGSTLLTLFPNPFAKERQKLDEDEGPRPLTLLVHGTDSLAIERGYSLLPVRTGTHLPEWIVVDKSSLWKGYGGVVGAGWYDQDWAFSEAMSYLS